MRSGTRQVDVILGAVYPRKISSFYTTALVNPTMT